MKTKKTINLYFDFEFTSLSPDAQPISLGIVSEDVFDKKYAALYSGKIEINKGNCSVDHLTSKSFYAEFSDFDLNRCDDWVKGNVVGKLKLKDAPYGNSIGYKNFKIEPDFEVKGDIFCIKAQLDGFLKQFSDYNIQSVCDCGTFDWYHLLQLIGEWDKKQICSTADNFRNNDLFECVVPNGNLEKCYHKKYFAGKIPKEGESITCNCMHVLKTGLPKLPSNVSPMPQDLNDLIAFKKGISIREAFNLNREELALGWYENAEREAVNQFKEDEMSFFGFPNEKREQKHNALWDAKIIKAIYEKLS